LTELLLNTNLEKIHANICGYNKFLGKFVIHVQQGVRTVYIVDTNAFIDQPDILSRLHPHELAVVSKKVINELDDKKSDDRLRERVQQVTRTLQDYTGDNIRYEEADISLLPQGFKAKGDNLILSVALKYKPCDPILLTSDRNLSVKAKMEGLRTLTLPDFNRRHPPSRSIPIKEIEKQCEHKKVINKANKNKRR
jgi:rRNA-processing protein FCF1